MTTTVSALDASMDGAWTVLTQEAAYLLDLDARTGTRITHSAEAGEAEAFTIVRLDRCQIAAPMVLALELQAPVSRRIKLITTDVVSIRPMGVVE
ncbi:hypothetical protein [Protaetiibacter intestinalis]|uniref:Uncharacterized protein n=1 Tax=Protaetiibacter intestinalis TaxID=2419774 RepID=A0A387B4F9_9MICO|nr:hypothetical protein [Protaetiibacter intestinalis]AYF97197.1 hypothetical protein D7I47_02325 [Protaetiibacter intestinalis]